MEILTKTNSCHMQYTNIPTAALDLCIRKQAASQNYSYEQSQETNIFVDSSTCPYSPVSNSDSEVSNLSTISDTSKSNKNYLTLAATSRKLTRPFKAYPKDPLNLAFGTPTTDIGKNSMEAFSEFRERVLSQVQANSGTNKNMRRVPQSSKNTKNSDPIYWEKRRKNNEAAKRSRDARRAKEDEIAIRCAFLEQENLQLKIRVASLESEKQKLQEIVYHR